MADENVYKKCKFAHFYIGVLILKKKVSPTFLLEASSYISKNTRITPKSVQLSELHSG